MRRSPHVFNGKGYAFGKTKKLVEEWEEEISVIQYSHVYLYDMDQWYKEPEYWQTQCSYKELEAAPVGCFEKELCRVGNILKSGLGNQKIDNFVDCDKTFKFSKTQQYCRFFGFRRRMPNR